MHKLTTIHWLKDISINDKQQIINKMNRIDNRDYDSFEELEELADGSGGFSLVFFVGDYALKRTDFWDHDELVFEGTSFEEDGYTIESFDMELQSDEHILLKLQGIEECVELIGYYGDWVILEKINASNLQDIEFFQESVYSLNDIHIEKLIQFAEGCLHRGVYPHDINEGSIFLLNDENIKIIDFNLYQTFDYFKKENIVFNPENISFRKIAENIVYNCYPVKKRQKRVLN